MALLPALLILLSTALSISYKLSRRCRFSRSIYRNITAAHAFYMETMQIILLIVGIIVSTQLSPLEGGQLVLANSDTASLRSTISLLTFLSYIIALFAIDIIDNKIQLGSFRHPVQMQTFLLTRSKLFPCTIIRLKKRAVISELEAEIPHSRIVEKDATPITPIRQTSSSRRVSITPGPGRVARLVSAFEEDLRNAPSPPQLSSTSHPTASSGSSSQEEEDITCVYGCNQNFGSWHEESLHREELHSSWFCAICTPNRVTATTYGPTYRTPAAVSRHLRIAHGIAWTFPERSVSAYAFFDINAPMVSQDETSNGSIDGGTMDVKSLSSTPEKQTGINVDESQKSHKSHSSGGSMVIVTPPTPTNTPALEAQDDDTLPGLVAPCLEEPTTVHSALVPFRSTLLLPPTLSSFNNQKSPLIDRPNTPLPWTSPPSRPRRNAFVPAASRHTAERLKQRSQRRAGRAEEFDVDG